MREAEIRKRIWQIIEDEITNAMWFGRNCELGEEPKGFDAKKHKTVFGFYKEQMRKRIDKLLDDNEAILVYQP